ncbi:acyl carrier protein [Pseudooceanicola sp. CBS1P-1]|uniref:Phosphopantetheine-binding protein n=1 Tax=Pseudooceanicola albus TaxID=2692189 RepID=A0A6L7G8K8_9RHOB|nr:MULTISPECIES: acyl carrier protein [Pseudooceanicola]MBT9386239.1 acyl carrier protein [Pseudooceanicola endophyticus]MXN20289.1 phosphopantetheine-binding protein [Pseudooceanicola albus]
METAVHPALPATATPRIARMQSLVIAALVELLDMEDDSQVGPDTRLEEDLGIDSGLLLELFMMIEEQQPEIRIDPANLRPEHFTNVASFAAMIAGTLQPEQARA